MSDCSIALDRIQIDDGPIGYINSIDRRTIMQIPSKFWIAVAIYLINLWCMTILIIMVLSELL
jgi:hypothetical protein